MMPSVHVTIATTLAVKTKISKTNELWFLFLVFVLHMLLDAVPHIEPSMFELSVPDPTSLGFWWTILDIGAGAYLTFRVMMNFPEHRRLIFFGFVGAFGPDVLQFGIESKALSGVPGMQTYYDVHRAMHWWKADLGYQTQLTIGIIATFSLWYVAWRFMPHGPAVTATAMTDKTAGGLELSQ
jgi:hypothetical protein